MRTVFCYALQEDDAQRCKHQERRRSRGRDTALARPRFGRRRRYDRRLRENLRDFTASYIPSELVFRPKVKLELRLATLLSVAAAWSLRGRARRRKED